MFVLKKRKYTWLDTFYIPFSCSPICTLGQTIQKILTALCGVFSVVIVAEFIDAVVASATNQAFDKEALKWFGLLALVLAWKRMGWRIGNLFAEEMSMQGTEQITNEYTKKCSKLAYYLLEDSEIQDLMSRITKRLNHKLKRMMQSFTNFFISNNINIIGLLIIIAREVWWLAIVVAFMTVPLIIVSLRGGKVVYKAVKEASEYERRHKYFFDVLTGRETVEERSLFGYTDYLNDEWLKQYDIGRKINLKATGSYLFNSNRAGILTNVVSSMVALIMVPLVASGKISIGVFMSLAVAVYGLVDALGTGMSKAVFELAQFQEYMKDLTRFAALPEVQEEDGSKELVQDFAELEFKNVTFRYPGSTVNILENFSMKLVKGKHYAIVGENGAGKSTLIKLLTGLYPDYKGEILLNGKEMKSFSAEEWRRLFAGVYQDFARYYISVEENIQIGDLNNMNTPESKGKMHQVAKKLNLHDDIIALRHRYATKLGKLDDDGVDFSGGQWQKVAMARALMSDAPLLILDEPTAALDPISESLVYEQFGAISKDRTTIFISHRLGSTKLADYIFVIGEGQVKEQGSHEELLQKDSVYAEMFRTQQSWYIGKEEEE